MLSPISQTGRFSGAQNRDIETAETIWSFLRNVRLPQ